MPKDYFSYTQTIEYAAEYLSKVFQEALKQVDKNLNPPVNHEEFIILETVYLNPGLIQSEIANKVSIQSSYVCKLLTSLEKSGFISR